MKSKYVVRINNATITCKKCGGSIVITDGYLPLSVENGSGIFCMCNCGHMSIDVAEQPQPLYSDLSIKSHIINDIPREIKRGKKNDG